MLPSVSLFIAPVDLHAATTRLRTAQSSQIYGIFGRESHWGIWRVQRGSAVNRWDRSGSLKDRGVWVALASRLQLQKGTGSTITELLGWIPP